MKNVRYIVLVLAFATLAPRAAIAQQGLNFIYPHLDRVYVKDGLPSVSLGFGYTKHLNERLAFGVDFTFLVPHILSLSDDLEKDLSYGQWQCGYTEQRGGVGLLYRTSFFLGDADRFCTYIGSTIGLLSVSRDVRITWQENNSDWYDDRTIWRDQYSESTVLFPVGLRFGARSPLDGFYAEFYVGVGYLIGGGDNLFSQPEMKDFPSTIAKMTWSLGYCMGVGWGH